MKQGITFKELQKRIVEPGHYTAGNKKTAILRLHFHPEFIEYPRKNLKKLFNELNERLLILHTGLDEPAETDRFLMTVLRRMGGDE